MYFAFDLLWLDGQDLRKHSQLARKELLKELIDSTKLKEPILYSEHHEGDGQVLFAAASKLNYQGIISKRVDLLTGRSGLKLGRRSRQSRRANSPWSAP
ncbi:hypothetical protein [Bradyrhizobium sp. B117]|uniref:ATP-dependent DNA ligase n=1 Tax=Bradyrhizobium sp. B117 TaxID=3140246 RepID=UPI0031833C92